MRALEKEAVRAGGGVNHRGGLHDAILVKENHAALAGGVGEAARRALADAPPGVPVEVECATLAEVAQAIDAGVPRLLLDNMSPGRAAAGRASWSTAAPSSRPRAASRSTTCARSPRPASDFISVGALTHSAPALDVSLLLEPL